jgi:nicotinamidase/pyrazinamidase
MLFIIDMQNNYLDKEKGENYVPGSEDLVSGIIEKIKEYKKKGDYIFYTLDIYAEKEKHSTNSNDLEDIEEKEEMANNRERRNFELHHSLKPHLEDYQCIKKSHYAIPPEELLKLQESFKKEHRVIREIEFVGVETHICVLSNAVCVRSAFPDANIIINSKLTKSIKEKDHKKALEMMEKLGMEIGR